MSGQVEAVFISEIEKWTTNLLKDYEIKRIRDDKVIRDAVYGFSLFYKHEINIIDSPLIQRLRGIFQTALTLFTYPSAVHSRFEHSLSCVGLSEKVLLSISGKNPKVIENNSHSWAEVRLAALLHDVGHCLLSHGSEGIYGNHTLFIRLRKENPKVFGGAQPHEIFSYFIIKSKAFKKHLLDPIKSLYKNENDSFCDLSKISQNRIADMILGHSPGGKSNSKYQAQIINGPFDVDKLDYLKRDGYFTGLQTSMDIDRLFITIATSVDQEKNERVLSTDLSGVTVLEQVLFSKMLIFATVYHHHKVRSALLAFKSIFELLSDLNGCKIKECDFTSPFHFLHMDDYELLNSIHQEPRLREAIDKLKNRILLQRALVISRDTMKDEQSWRSLIRKMGGEIEKLDPLKSEGFSKYMRKKIAEESGCDPLHIYFDIPEPPRFGGIAKESKVRRYEGDRLLCLDDIYPTKGWVSGYAMYRYRIYVFCLDSDRKRVAESAYRVLKANKIYLNKKAFIYAKHGQRFAQKVMDAS